MRSACLFSFFLAGLALALHPTDAAAQREASTPAEILHAPTVDDLLAITNITEARLSTDGEWLIYVMSTTDLETGAYHQNLWRVHLKTKDTRQMTHGPQWIESIDWHPDGTSIGFVSDIGGTNQVYRMRVDGGEAEALTSAPNGITSFAWSPQGDQIAYITRDEPSEQQRARKAAGTDVKLMDDGFTMNHLHVLDLANGNPRRLTGGNEYTVVHLSWSPDGKRIAFTGQETPRVVDWFFGTDLYTVDVETAEVRSLVARPGMDVQPRWSPDGKRIAFFSHDGVKNWIGCTYVCVVPAAGGPPRNISSSFAERIYNWDAWYEWNADSKHVWFVAPRGVTDQLVSLDADDGSFEEFSHRDGIIATPHTSRDGERMVFLSSNPLWPTEVFVTSTGRFDPQRVTHTNSQLANVQIEGIETLRWENEGFTIEGLLLRPHEEEPGHRYPLLVALHGGPSGHSTKSFTPQTGAGGFVQIEAYPYQVLASEGYAILWPNFRGSGGYGKEFLYANVEDWGDGDLRDVLAGIDVLVADGLVDPQRVGVMGWSYGGTLAAFSLTQTDRFKAASVGAGVTNHLSSYSQMDIPPFLEAYFGGTPAQNSETYLRSSTMAHIQNIRTPALLQYGENDLRVPLAQGKELYWGLKAQGGVVEMAIYPRSGHIVFEPKLQRDMMQRNIDWFERWIGGGPTPTPESR